MSPGLLALGARLTGRQLPRLAPRLVAPCLAAVGWLPLALLTALEGRLAGHGLSFGQDMAVHVRFLLVVPLLIAFGPLLDTRLSTAIEGWRRTGLVPPDRRAPFDRFVGGIERVLQSGWAAGLTVILAYALDWLEWSIKRATGLDFWVAGTGAPGPLSWAGWWYVLVSAPLMYTLLLRWLWRFGLWTALLVRLALLPARVLPTHADGAGGLGGIVRLQSLLLPYLLALSALEAAGLANLILHQGRTVQSVRFIGIAFILASLVVFLGPLLLFSPSLLERRRTWLSRYGAVATRHAEQLQTEIERRLQTGSTGPSGPLLPGELLSAQADLATSFSVGRTMRGCLIDREHLILFVLVAAGPLLLLTLAEVPIVDLLGRFKAIFL